jgi:AcrR family transcriptional regulator
MAATADISQYAHGRVPRDVRRAQIAELAEELFAEHGYAGVSMAELSRRAGVTKPVVYEIFGSKEGLYRACVERTAGDLAERVTSAVTATDAPIDQLRAGVAAWFAFAAEHRRAWDVLYAGEGRFADAIETVRRRQAALVAGLLGAIARERGVELDARQLDATAQAINGATETVAMWAKDHADLSPEVLADWSVALLGPGLLAMTTQEQA